MKKIAVTGANGFIGSSLCRRLEEEGHEVICLVRPGSDVSLLPTQANILRIDYNDKAQIRQALSDCQILIHLAALTRARKWQEFEKTNINLVKDLVELCCQLPDFEQFIFLSSQAASGPSQSGIGKHEDDECHPVSLYGKSKLAAEQVIRSNCHLPWTIIRPTSVFGPGDKDFYEYYKLIQRGIAPLAGISDRYLSLIHVEDLCQLIILTINNPKAYNECFFAASSENISLAGFAYIIAQAMNKKIFNLRIASPILWLGAALNDLVLSRSKNPPVFNRQKYKEMTQRYWLASNRKATELLGFRQSMTLTRQMRQTIQWYKDKNLL